MRNENNNAVIDQSNKDLYEAEKNITESLNEIKND